MNIMADHTAAMAEHSNHPLTQKEISPQTPVQTIIMTAAEKTHVTEKLSWWETFKRVFFFTSLALVFAFLFACFRYFGIFACLYAMCCKPRNIYAHAAVLAALEVKLWTHHHLSKYVICFHLQSRFLFKDYGT
jgi:hypothetical protein